MAFIWRRKRSCKFVSHIRQCYLVGRSIFFTTLAEATDEVQEGPQQTTPPTQEEAGQSSCCNAFLKAEEAVAQSLTQVVALQGAFLNAMTEWITAPTLNPLTGEKLVAILSEKNRDLLITFTDLERQVAEMITRTLTNLPSEFSSPTCQSETCIGILSGLNGKESDSDDQATLTKWIAVTQAFLTEQHIPFTLSTSQAPETLTCSDRPDLINRLVELFDQALNRWKNFGTAWQALEQLPHSQSLGTAIEALSKALNDAQQTFADWLSLMAPGLCPNCSLQFNDGSSLNEKSDEEKITGPFAEMKNKANNLCSSVFQHTLIYIDHDVQTLTLWLKNGLKALQTSKQNPMWDPASTFSKTVPTFSEKLKNLSAAVQELGKLSALPPPPCWAETLSAPMKSLAVALNQTCLAWIPMAEQTFEGTASSLFTIPLSAELLISHARALCEAFVSFSSALVEAASDTQRPMLIASLNQLSLSLRDFLPSLDELSLPSITFCNGADFDPEPYRNCLPEIAQSLAPIPEALEAAKSKLIERNCCNAFASCLYRISQVLTVINQSLDDEGLSNALQTILGRPSPLPLKAVNLDAALENAVILVKNLSDRASSQEDNATCLFEFCAETFAQLERHALTTTLRLIPEAEASLKTDWDTSSFGTETDCHYLKELFRRLRKQLQTFLGKLLPHLARSNPVSGDSQQPPLSSGPDQTFSRMAEALKSWEEILAWKGCGGLTLCSACSLHPEEVARETAIIRTLFKQAQETFILLKRTPTLQKTLSTDESVALETNHFLRATEEEQDLRPILLQAGRPAQLVHAVEEQIGQAEYSLSHITGALGVS